MHHQMSLQSYKSCSLLWKILVISFIASNVLGSASGEEINYVQSDDNDDTLRPKRSLLNEGGEVLHNGLSPALAQLLKQYVLIKTKEGYILGRNHRSLSPENYQLRPRRFDSMLSDFSTRQRRLPAAEKNFQLRLKRMPAEASAERNFQLRLRKKEMPTAESNFQLRLKKSLDYDNDNAYTHNEPLNIMKKLVPAESNFQLRLKKSATAARRGLNAERNFQLRIRKSSPNSRVSIEDLLLNRYGLLRTNDGYILKDMEKRDGENNEFSDYSGDDN